MTDVKMVTCAHVHYTILYNVQTVFVYAMYAPIHQTNQPVTGKLLNSRLF